MYQKSPNNPLKSILHPYIFVLKEGQKIKNDFLDYSLMMLFVQATETIKSPDGHIELSSPNSNEQEFIEFLGNF